MPELQGAAHTWDGAETTEPFRGAGPVVAVEPHVWDAFRAVCDRLPHGLDAIIWFHHPVEQPSKIFSLFASLFLVLIDMAHTLVRCIMSDLPSSGVTSGNALTETPQHSSSLSAK
jgi:hypothetical protein